MQIAAQFCLISLFCIWFASCGNEGRLDRNIQEFKRHYDALPLDEPVESGPVKDSQTITITANAVPLVDLLRQISDQTGVSIIASQNLDKENISLEIKSATVDAVLGAVARRLGNRLTKIGSIYYLGQISPEDRAFLVRRLHRLNKDDLEKVMALFVSEFGKFVAFNDGLLVFTDRVEILERLASAFDKMETAESPSWVVQVYLISVGQALSHKLGIDLSQSLTLSYKVNNSPNNSNITGSLNALLVSSHDDNDSRVIAQPMFLIKDGSNANLTDGVNQPVPKYTVSPQGTIETTGFEIVQTGLIISAGVREETGRRANLKLSIELSKINGYFKDYPIISKQKMDTDVSIDSAGTYLVGALSQSNSVNQLSGEVLPSVWLREKDSKELQVWLRAYRIRGPAFEGQPSGQPGGQELKP